MTSQNDSESMWSFVTLRTKSACNSTEFSKHFLIGALLRLAQQSEYGPGEISLKEFIEEFFVTSGLDQNEEKMLFVVLDDQRHVTGFLQARSLFETADLDFVVVEHRQRGKGLGGQLLRRFESELRGRGVLRVMLEVASGNKDALHLYLKTGYKKISVRKSYYRTGEDALVMEKVL
ncbi:MAG: GNAT family N-acetyltransferase [Silvanigrellaceae bacterium]